MKCILNLFVIVFFFYLNTNAESYKHTQYTVDNGLISNNIYKLFQDSKGNLWIGSVNGISKFDGYKFTNYTTRDGLDENFVVYFSEDKNNRVWYLTYSGYIGFINNDKVSSFPLNNQIINERQNSRPTSLVITPNNQIYIGYRSNNLLKISFDSGIEKNLHPNNYIYLYKFDDKYIYGVNKTNKNKKTLSIYSNNKLKLYSKVKSLSDDSFICAHSNNKFKTIILCFKYDVIIIKNQKITIIYNLLNDYITDVFIDRDEKIWFSTRFNGIYEFKSINSIGEEKPDNYYPEKTCSNIIQDNAGTFWMSFIREGLFNIPSMDIKTYTFDNKEEDMLVNSMCKYRDVLFFSTYYGKLFR